MKNLDFDIEARHIGYSKDIHRVHVSVHELGFHIMSLTVRKSKKNDTNWWVQPPAHKSRSSYKWYRDINFELESVLWKAIEGACIDQVEEYIRLDNLSDESIRKGLDEAIKDNPN